MKPYITSAEEKVRTHAVDLLGLVARFNRFVGTLALDGDDQLAAVQLRIDADNLIALSTGVTHGNQTEQAPPVFTGRRYG